MLRGQLKERTHAVIERRDIGRDVPGPRAELRGIYRKTILRLALGQCRERCVPLGDVLHERDDARDRAVARLERLVDEVDAMILGYPVAIGVPLGENVAD